MQINIITNKDIHIPYKYPTSAKLITKMKYKINPDVKIVFNKENLTKNRRSSDILNTLSVNNTMVRAGVIREIKIQYGKKSKSELFPFVYSQPIKVIINIEQKDRAKIKRKIVDTNAFRK